MGNRNNVAIMSVLIALIALVILILSLAFVIMSQPATKAKIENIISPLDAKDSYTPQNIINIHDASDDDDEEEDNGPVISGLPDMTLNFAQTVTLDLDNYASDDEDSHSDLDFTILYTSTVSPDPLTISIDSVTHVLTITESNGIWTGTQAVTIRVEDTDGNRDEDSFTVTTSDGTTLNNAPTFTSSVITSATEDSLYTYNIITEDIDGDNLTISSTTLPSWLILTDNGDGTATLTGIPLNGDVGDNNVVLTVTDGIITSPIEQSFIISVTNTNDPTNWLPLSDQTINEDTPVGTIVYANIASRVSDDDGPVIINIASSNTHFTVNMNGNDLVITQINKNWYGFETITLEANGVTATFKLNVNQLIDDCIEICSYSTCYTYCD